MLFWKLYFLLITFLLIIATVYYNDILIKIFRILKHILKAVKEEDDDDEGTPQATHIEIVEDKK